MPCLPGHEYLTARRLFGNTFGADLGSDGPGAHPLCAASAPGRVNLIGEHVDYVDGFVMPLALTRCCVAVGRVTSTGVCRCVSSDAPATGDGVVEWDASAAPPPGQPAWANYVKGVVWQHLKSTNGDAFSFDVAVASSVPLGGGLSSSAALEVAVATLLEALSAQRSAGYSPKPPLAKAYRCQAAEHEYCGVPCGIMDQAVSCLATKGHALLLDCRASHPEPPRHVPMDDPSVALLVCNTNVKHALGDSQYPVRVEECQRATAGVASVESKNGVAADDASGGLRGKCPLSLSDVLCHPLGDTLDTRRRRHGV